MCFSPLVGYRSRVANPETGKREIVFNARFGFTDLKVLVPCGKCAECAATFARQRALRCWLESLYTKGKSCVLTLTYDDEHLPDIGSVREVKDYQCFLKRLRKHLQPLKVRYFGCGEYGEITKRFHYHIIIYGFDFPDKMSLKRTDSGSVQYTSELLSRLWPFGFATVGALSPRSCSYIAGYVNKKLDGSLKSFSFGSRKPGIGSVFMQKYGIQALRNGFIVMDGVKYSIPRFYLDKLDSVAPDDVLAYKVNRFYESIANRPDCDKYRYGDFVPVDYLNNRRRMSYFNALGAERIKKL